MNRYGSTGEIATAVIERVPGELLPHGLTCGAWCRAAVAPAPRGVRGVREDRRAFARLLSDTQALAGWYDDAEFAATACALNHDDRHDALAPVTAELLHSLAYMPPATAP